jgi:hypothetical protein
MLLVDPAGLDQLNMLVTYEHIVCRGSEPIHAKKQRSRIRREARK